MKKRKSLKPAFVVTIAAGAVALAAGGCSGEVALSNSSLVHCPDATPRDGDVCQKDAQTCDYPGAGACEHLRATCSGGQWSVASEIAPCNPPYPDCGDETPAPGAACDVVGGSCFYLDACGSSTIVATCTTSGWQVDSSQACACPESLPKGGTDCPLGVGPCYYGTYEGKPAYTATCTEAGWDVDSAYDPPACNPPPYCPQDPPFQGDSCYCNGFGSECDYVDECGQPIYVHCTGSQWQVTYTSDCIPPPPCESLEQDACALQETCVWHVPGCGDPEVPSLPEAGCFSTTPCETDDDCSNGYCFEVMVEPDCVDEGCNACGEAVKVCIQI